MLNYYDHNIFIKFLNISYEKYKTEPSALKALVIHDDTSARGKGISITYTNFFKELKNCYLRSPTGWFNIRNPSINLIST